jgi:4-diphosphocytidyl-2-C-methyl-D-erythritol kinase
MSGAGRTPAAPAPPPAGGTEVARAKLNLTLAVLGRRPDGFHALDSVFLRLALADAIAAAPAPPHAAGDTLSVEGSEWAATDDDLILRAARLLRAEDPTLPVMAFGLAKRVPVAAGLGGGSADAAAALRLAARLGGTTLTAQRLHALALRLGSDVPFFAADVPAARVTGRGESLDPLPPPPAGLAALIVVAGPPLSTAAVFARHAAAAGEARGDAGGLATREATDVVADALRAGLTATGFVDRFAGLGETNDLWSAAADLDPGLVRRRAELEGRLGSPLRLSGSGPSLFCLYPSVEAAMDGLDVSAALAGPLGLRQVLVSGFA